MTLNDTGDSDLAAALVLAVESGLSSVAEARRVVDFEIEARPTADPWLVEASLASTPEDVLHALRERAGEHPMLSDPLASLDAAEIALARSRVDIGTVVSPIMKLYPYEGMPAELKKLVWELDEEVTCAHGHGGVPDPQCVEIALRNLLAAAHGKSPWRRTLEACLALTHFKERAAEQ